MQERIAPLDLPLAGETAAAMAKLVPPPMAPPRLFLAFARNEGLFRQFVDAGLLGPTGLLDRRTLDRPLRECVILRTCVATKNDYEFNLHVQTISERMGLSPARIADVRNDAPDPALWSERERAAMRLVDDLVRLDVRDPTWDECRRHFDEATLVELTQLAGLYFGVAMLVALVRPGFDLYRFAQPVLAQAGSAIPASMR